MEATFCQLMDPRLGIITLTTSEVYLLEVYLGEPSFNANISNRESRFIVVKSLLCWFLLDVFLLWKRKQTEKMKSMVF